jgi:hypothetical protein
MAMVVRALSSAGVVEPVHRGAEVVSVVRCHWLAVSEADGVNVESGQSTQ